MTAKTRTTGNTTQQAATSTSIRERIDAERKRLAEEGEREKQLEAARVPLLECGNDAELDRIEAAINECRAAQIRTGERIELLTARLSEREQVEERQKLETLRERADRLREFGERLIRDDYAKAAGALADVLRRLRAVDCIIEEANHALARAGIECVVPTNAIRCQRSRTETVTRKRRVGLGDPAHPYHGRAQAPYNRATGTEGETWNPEVIAENGDRTRVFVEVDEEMRVHHTAEIQEVLHKAIALLPSATASHVPLYEAERSVDAAAMENLRAEYGL
ncbi:MAG: hypothetical protein AMXMBFR59_06830 [Rhodanobacteraceae bacterium]